MAWWTPAFAGVTDYGVGRRGLVAFAGILAWANRASPIPPNDAPLAVMGEGFEGIALWLGPLLFFGLIAGVYVMTRKAVRGVSPTAEPESAAEDVANYR